MSGSVSRDFRKKGQCAGGLAGRARPGWPLIKKRTAGPTPTCMGPAVLYRRIRRRVQNPVYSPNNEACLINRHAMPLAGTQCLSRLQRTHGVFRAYGGRTASFRTYGGRTASFAPTADARRLFAPTADARRLFAPTADARRLSRLRRSLRKQTAKSLLSAPQGKPYRSR